MDLGTLPTWDQFRDGIAAWSAPLFTDVTPVVYFELGIIFGGAAIVWLVSIFPQALAWVFKVLRHKKEYD